LLPSARFASLGAMASFQLAEDRWCPTREKPFLATVVIETSGGERRSEETLCPPCGRSGEPFLQIPGED
jgi:hypothetical protein